MKIWNLFTKKYWKNKQELRHKFKEIANKKTEIDPNLALSINNLTKVFYLDNGDFKFALDEVTFKVNKGEFHGFIGDNGAGKTTTIRSILGFYPSAKGQIYVNGTFHTDVRSRNSIGYIPEIAIFPKKLNVREYLMEMGKMSKLSKNQIKKKIDELIAKFNFDEKDLNKSPFYMSSGQKKKVLLMQALLNDPEILILDEPAANLDPTARLDFFHLIKNLNKEGKTIFISSHILSELEQYIDSFTVLQNGKVLDSGKVIDKLKSFGFNKQMSLANYDTKSFEEYLIQNKIQFKFQNNKYFLNVNDKQINQVLSYCLQKGYEIVNLGDVKLNLNNLYFGI